MVRRGLGSSAASAAAAATAAARWSLSAQARAIARRRRVAACGRALSRRMCSSSRPRRLRSGCARRRRAWMRRRALKALWRRLAAASSSAGGSGALCSVMLVRQAWPRLSRSCSKLMMPAPCRCSSQKRTLRACARSQRSRSGSPSGGTGPQPIAGASASTICQIDVEKCPEWWRCPHFHSSRLSMFARCSRRSSPAVVMPLAWRATLTPAFVGTRPGSGGSGPFGHGCQRRGGAWGRGARLAEFESSSIASARERARQRAATDRQRARTWGAGARDAAGSRGGGGGRACVRVRATTSPGLRVLGFRPLLG